MAICELDPKYKIGPIEIGKKIGQEVTTFPQFRIIKALHRTGWAVLDDHPIYGDHETMVLLLSPDEIKIVKCLHKEPCRLTETRDRIFRHEAINEQIILSDSFRWL